MKPPHELASAIVALINAKPRSPTLAELEAVIGQHVAAPGARVALTDKGPALETLLVVNGDRDPIWSLEPGSVTVTCVDDEFRRDQFHQIDRIDPANLVAVLGKAPNGRDAHWAGPPQIEYEGLDITILHADPFVLMSLPGSQPVRTINGYWIKPNQLLVRWYDDESDCVRLELVPSWGLARALAPEKYAALMTARHEIKGS